MLYGSSKSVRTRKKSTAPMKTMESSIPYPSKPDVDFKQNQKERAITKSQDILQQATGNGGAQAQAQSSVLAPLTTTPPPRPASARLRNKKTASSPHWRNGVSGSRNDIGGIHHKYSNGASAVPPPCSNAIPSPFRHRSCFGANFRLGFSPVAGTKIIAASMIAAWILLSTTIRIMHIMKNDFYAQNFNITKVATISNEIETSTSMSSLLDLSSSSSASSLTDDYSNDSHNNESNHDAFHTQKPRWFFHDIHKRKPLPRSITLPPKPLVEPHRPSPHAKKFPQYKVRRVSLLGERNSGTRWVFSELERCFGHYNSSTLELKSHLTRWKHWFQPDWDNIEKHTPTLVLSVFRNPYEWVEAMRVTPHHAPAHAGKKHGLDWQHFVTKPWTMPRPKRDLQLHRKEGPVCYEHFQYNELVSCVEGNKTHDEYLALFDTKTGLNRFGRKITDHDPEDFSAHKPVYELRQDGSGEPYDSIIAMRADKIRNFLSVAEWEWVADSVPIQYERLLEEGTHFLLSLVEEFTGLERSCNPSGPQQERKKRTLDPDFVRWMNQNVDWDAEALVGYERMSGVAQRVSVLGERNSGETQTYEELKRCFPGKRIDDKLVREKHWFQPPEAARESKHTPTLVLFQVRDPYTWTEEMRRRPISAPEHFGCFPWKHFVTKPWTMDRPKRDNRLKDKSGRACFERFQYNELISCVEGSKEDEEYLAMFDSKTGKNILGYKMNDPHDFSAHRPMYELRPDGSGRPFDSVVDLRAAKIRNAMSLQSWPWIADVVPITFEHIITSTGLEDVIGLVEDYTGWKRSCDIIHNGEYVKMKHWSKYWSHGFDMEYIEWMNNHVDWEAEAMVGYEKRSVSMQDAVLLTDDSLSTSNSKQALRKQGQPRQLWRVPLYDGMGVSQNLTATMELYRRGNRLCTIAGQ